jgi:hypothetical protein
MSNPDLATVAMELAGNANLWPADAYAAILAALIAARNGALEEAAMVVQNDPWSKLSLAAKIRALRTGCVA